MKKMFLLLLILPLFFACSEDDKKGTAEYLIGTTWSGVNDKVDVSLNFTKENGANLNSGGISIWYDYYEKDRIIYLNPQKDGFYPFECSIKDNIMSVTNSKTGKVTYILYKK